ncbi:hypothetical protein EV424DRAFT_1534282 [Suillus variegatus]|nr:hypothetical protein EV424DRAFT_1534282 [Suillus variegatus]
MRIHPDKAEDVNLLNSSPGCICLWPTVLSDKQQALLRSFTATIRIPDLDLPARRRRWLQLFGRDDLAETISSSNHVSIPTARDIEALSFLREIVKISWYELDGMNGHRDCHETGANLGWSQPPQEVKEDLKA